MIVINCSQVLFLLIYIGQRYRLQSDNTQISSCFLLSTISVFSFFHRFFFNQQYAFCANNL